MAETTLSNNKPVARIPFGGRLLFPNEEKHEATVVIVPFYQGRQGHLQRHIQMILDLGFKVCVFDLYSQGPWRLDTLFSSRDMFGLKSIWADQIEGILNSFDGPKIIFAFSNPSASAFEAIARRNAVDVLGMICDSGPSGNFISSIVNMLRQEKRAGPLPLRWATALTMSLGWSLDFKNVVHKDLANLPEGFPILSIRGWKDKIVTPYDIDKVFEPHPQLQWKKLSLPMAEHLNGLRDFPDEYRAPVAEFLKSLA